MARPVRVGVVADTHVGDILPALPPGVIPALGDVDLILHAGDVSVPSVLDELRRVAPVVAVRGNHDEGRMPGLPAAVRVRVGDTTIGLTHGMRAFPVEAGSVAATAAFRRPVTLGLARAMARRFPGAACVVFGHWHMPVHTWVGGTLVFSPGAVFTAEREGLGRMRAARARLYRRYRSALPPVVGEPAVGVLEVSEGRVTARRVPVEGPLRVRRRR